LDTRQGDAFAVLEALAAEGAQFDLVICDPPAFAPIQTGAGGGPARL
jgi:23S rRNA (cytosine1962-C5)-methyltransferase